MPLSVRIPGLSLKSRAPRPMMPALPSPNLTLVVLRWERCGDASCLGWIHANPDEHDCTGREVQRCDECERFDCDASAQLAHVRECGCEWGAPSCEGCLERPQAAGRGGFCAACADAIAQLRKEEGLDLEPAAPTRGPSCEPCGGLERVGDAECFDCRPVSREPQEEECDYCGGTGKHFGEECDVCEGAGAL
jgi:hypothetical protein